MSAPLYRGIVVELSNDNGYIVSDFWGNKELCVLHHHTVDAPPRVGEEVLYKKGTSISLGVITSVFPSKTKPPREVDGR